MKIKEILRKTFFFYSPSLISIGYLLTYSSRYYFFLWIMYVGIIIFLIKTYNKKYYRKDNNDSDNYYFKMEKALLNFITYMKIGRSLESSMKNILLRRNDFKEISNIYKLLRNGTHIKKALKRYDSDILKIISQISLYSRKEFLTQASKAINFIRKDREISRKFLNRIKIIRFRLKLIGIIISLSLSISCHILYYVSPYKKIDENILVIFFSLILSISNFHILSVFENRYYKIFSETLFLEILYFSTIIFLKYFLF